MTFWIILQVCLIWAVSAQDFFNNRPHPTYSLESMPDTSFTCRDKILGGYYADSETQCQMFHICVKVAGVGVQDFRFLCPNGTAFDQDHQICAEWDDVDCDATTLYYASDNFDLYRLGSGFESKAVKYGEEEEPFALQRAETGDIRLNREHQAGRVNQQKQFQDTPRNRNANAGRVINNVNQANQANQASQRDSERDIFKTSSSSNFFNNRNNGKEEDDDYTGGDNNRGNAGVNANQNRDQVGRRKLVRKRPVDNNNNNNNYNNIQNQRPVSPAQTAAPVSSTTRHQRPRPAITTPKFTQPPVDTAVTQNPSRSTQFINNFAGSSFVPTKKVTQTAPTTTSTENYPIGFTPGVAPQPQKPSPFKVRAKENQVNTASTAGSTGTTGNNGFTGTTSLPSSKQGFDVHFDVPKINKKATSAAVSTKADNFGPTTFAPKLNFNKNNGQRFNQNNAPVQQQNQQQYQNKNQFQNPQQNFQQNNGQIQKQNFQQNNGQNQKQNFQQNNGQNQKQNFQQNNGQNQKQNFQQNNGQNQNLQNNGQYQQNQKQQNYQNNGQYQQNQQSVPLAPVSPPQGFQSQRTQPKQQNFQQSNNQNYQQSNNQNYQQQNNQNYQNTNNQNYQQPSKNFQQQNKNFQQGNNQNYQQVNNQDYQQNNQNYQNNQNFQKQSTQGFQQPQGFQPSTNSVPSSGSTPSVPLPVIPSAQFPHPRPFANQFNQNAGVTTTTAAPSSQYTPTVPRLTSTTPAPVTPKRSNRFDETQYDDGSYNPKYDYNYQDNQNQEDEFLKTAHSQNIAKSRNELIQNQKVSSPANNKVTNNVATTTQRYFSETPRPFSKAPAPQNVNKNVQAPVNPQQNAPVNQQYKPQVNQQQKAPVAPPAPPKVDKNVSYDYAYYDTNVGNDPEYDIETEFKKTT